MSAWRNRLARSTVNREVVGSIPTEDAHFLNILTDVYQPTPDVYPHVELD